MTDPILINIKDWTGANVRGCPWRPLMNDPLVHWVVKAWRFFENGTLSMYAPEPTHREMEALRVFAQARDEIKSIQARKDAEAAARGRKPS